MTNLFGADFGERLRCRVCQYDLFLVERGTGTVNDEPVSIMTIRCNRCGTVLDHLQIDWKGFIKPEDKVVINDGIKRE